jgi:hypothetical protein
VTLWVYLIFVNIFVLDKNLTLNGIATGLATGGKETNKRNVVALRSLDVPFAKTAWRDGTNAAAIGKRSQGPTREGPSAAPEADEPTNEYQVHARRNSAEQVAQPAGNRRRPDKGPKARVSKSAARPAGGS